MISLGERERQEIADVLKTLLASTFTFYLKTQNYHWNLKGKEFYAMHKFFQEEYEELAKTIDEMAERVRSLGFFVEGGMETFTKLSLIKDETAHDQSIEQMVKKQLADHETLIEFMRGHLPMIEGFHDGATADFINKRLAVHEKMAWMLRSTLQ